MRKVSGFHFLEVLFWWVIISLPLGVSNKSAFNQGTSEGLVIELHKAIRFQLIVFHTQDDCLATLEGIFFHLHVFFYAEHPVALWNFLLVVLGSPIPGNPQTDDLGINPPEPSNIYLTR